MKHRIGNLRYAIGLLLAVCLWGSMAAAQNQIQGVITGRSGATMTVKTQDGESIVVALTPATQVQEVEGAFKMRKKELAMTALIPGLPVQVKGSMNAQNQLAADTVKFKGSDLKAAQDMQAGIAPTAAEVAANQAEIKKQQEELAAAQAVSAAHQQEIAASQAKIAANKSSNRSSEQAVWRTGGVQHPW